MADHIGDTNKMLTADQLAAICARAEAAHNEEWVLGGCSGRMITTPSGYVGDGFIADVDTLVNAAFIAHARQDIPLLLAHIEALHEEIKVLRTACTQMIVCTGGSEYWNGETHDALLAIEDALRQRIREVTK